MLTFQRLRQANMARQIEWDRSDQKIGLGFRAIELAGETGEACNIVKKLEREKLGLKGSRATTDDLAQELADVVICADLTALAANIDLGQWIVDKFDATSMLNGLTTRLRVPAPAPAAEPVWQWWAGTSDDVYSVGPCATREEAIGEAFGENDIDPKDPEANRSVSIHVVEAIQAAIDLGTEVDLQDHIQNDLEDSGSLAEYQNEDGDQITEHVTDAQWQDLQARFRSLVAEWQTDHGIALHSWRFTQMRNAEQVWPPKEPVDAHPMAQPLTEEEHAILEKTLDEMYPTSPRAIPEAGRTLDGRTHDEYPQVKS